jgi:predicted ATP-binding protein involved in virulence
MLGLLLMSEFGTPSIAPKAGTAPFRLAQLRVHEVGPFVDFSLDFPAGADKNLAEVHIFTGPNGSGKSTLLAAISALFAVWPIGAKELERLSRSELSFVAAEIDANGGELRLGPSDRAVLNPIAVGWGRLALSLPKESWAMSAIISLVRQSPGHSAAVGFGVLAYSAAKQFRSGIIQSYDAPSAVESRRAASFFGREPNDSAVQWLANTLTNISLAKTDGDNAAAATYEASISEICQAVSAVVGASFALKLNRRPLEVMAVWAGQSIPVAQLPDGLKSVLSLLADISMRLDAMNWERAEPISKRPFVLLLDEIDVHLHPKWQRQIVSVLQRSFPNAQIFVSTHSPFVVASVSDAWVYTLDPSKSHVAPEKSGAGQSLLTVIKDVFEIDEQFDPETEALFDKFYAERSRAMQTKQVEQLKVLGAQLSDRGAEVDDIVNSEIHQVERKIALPVN